MLSPLRRSKLTAYLGNPQFLSLAGNVIVAGLSVLSSSLIFRSLPVQETGTWILFVTLLGLLDSIRAGFITTAFIRAYAGAAVARAAEVMGSTWLIALLITGLFGVLNLVALVLPLHDSSLTVFLHWFSVTFVATLPGFLAGCVLQAEMRFDKLLYLRLMSQGLFVVGIVALMGLGQMSLLHLLYCNIFREAVTSLASLLLGWTNVRMLRHRTSACAKEMGHFGKYSIGSFIGSVLLRDADTFVISYLLGPAALAIYNLAQRFMEFVEIPLRSSLSTAMPAMAAAYNQHDKVRLREVMQRYAGVTTWALVPIIVVICLGAELLVYLLGGSKYTGTEAAGVLRIFIVGAIIFPIDRYFGVALDVINQPKMNLIKVFITLVVSVVTDVVGIWLTHSIYGVVLAGIPTMLTGLVFGYQAFSRYSRLSIPSIIETGFVESKKLLAAFVLNLRPAKAH